MAKVFNYITINYEKDIYTPSIDMMQGDTGRGLTFSIASPIDGLDDEISNLTATLNVVKPTGETQTVTGTIESLGNDMAKVTIEPSSNLASAIDVSGLAMATLVIANATQTVTSFNFKIKIKPNPFYPKPTVRKFDVTKVSRITGVQQYEHEVQSIQFVGLNYTGNVYIVLENEGYNADAETEGYNNTIPLTDYTFIIGQPMTNYSGVFKCQLFGETTTEGVTSKFEITPIFYIEVDESVKQGESTQYPIDPNVKIGIDEYIDEKKDEILDKAYDAFLSKTVNGEPIYFDDGADDIPVKELIVNLEPNQSGTGNPSPSNVRPITGYDGVTVSVNDEEYSITFPSSVGTVYGGTLDVTTGVLTVDRYYWHVDPTKIPDNYIHFDVLTNNARVGGLNIISQFDAPSAKYNGSVAKQGFISNWLPERNRGYSTDETGFYLYDYRTFYLFFPKSIFSAETATAFKQYLTDNPLYICYVLETPQTYQLTPTEVSTLLGSNTFSSNGTTIDLTYRADTTLTNGTYGVVHFVMGDPSTADMAYESAVSMHLSGKPLTAYVTVGTMTAVSKEYVYTGNMFVFGISITGVASGTVQWSASGVTITIE